MIYAAGMETAAVSPRTTSASALAILVAAAGARRFAPTTRLHDRALFELSELAERGLLMLDTDAWRFVPSANGGYAFVGLTKLLLVLSEEGWLRRDHVERTYVVSPEFQEWGSRALSALSAEERRRVGQVARRWKARACVSAKKVA
jgi:hypothetical protein